MPTTDEVITPFGEPVVEVPLPDSPLVAVIAQVRFPAIASIAREEFIGPFQERIRARYPVLRREREVNVVLTTQGLHTGSDSAPVWRFLDDGDRPTWKVSLASSFLALDTCRYESRHDFLTRFRFVLEALAETVEPASCERLGVRYVDRVLLDDPDIDLVTLVRAEVLGVAATDPGSGAALEHTISDTEFRLDDATLRARWGRLPAFAQLDPFHGEAPDAVSWILDLDMYAAGIGPFSADSLTSAAASFAERIYRFFRWAVRPELLTRYGGVV
jgi:uncharacterized protein (TIGR04255 family)